MTKTEFLERVPLEHRSKFDYSLLPEHFRVKSKVQIICKKHGVFEQQASVHAQGFGCKKCKVEKVSSARRNSYQHTKQTIENKFEGKILLPELDYSPLSSEKITAVCSEHGRFQTTLKQLMVSQFGCPECGKARRKLRVSANSLVHRIRKVHSGQYDYNLEELNSYTNNQHKITIICKKHGPFIKSVKRHLQGEGCPICKREGLWEQKRAEESAKVISELKEKNPELDFSKADYINNRTKLKVICPKHGEQLCSIKLLKSGRGCTQCYLEEKRHSSSEWVNKFKRVHGDTYDYSKVPDTKTHRGKIPIICNRHKQPYIFYQTTSDHAEGHGCPRCKMIQVSSGPSKQEKRLVEFISKFANVDTQVELKSEDSIFYIDACVESRGLMVEYNGTYFHSEKFVAKDCHHKKLTAAESRGYQLIHIFEDDWKYETHRVEHFLKAKLGALKTVGARKTEVKSIDNTEARQFYNLYHMQGSPMYPNPVHLGLFLGNELTAVMSFSQSSSGRRVMPEGHWELTRFASKYRVQGGASKLFKHFVKNHNPKSVLSFSWTHMFNGNMYQVLGFKLDKILPPDYQYVHPSSGRRLHKSGFQKKHLRTKFPDTYSDDLTEHEMCLMNKVYRIYDCGKKRWVWNP